MKIFKVAQVNWDAKDGIGAVPNNQDIDYRGFVKEMTPSEFLSLASPKNGGEESEEFLDGAMDRGEALGQPFLQVHWDEGNKQWLISGHEGRSRAKSILNKYGDIKMPVHIFPDYLRARDVTEEMKQANFVSEDLSKTLMKDSW